MHRISSRTLGAHGVFVVTVSTRERTLVSLHVDLPWETAWPRFQKTACVSQLHAHSKRHRKSKPENRTRIIFGHLSRVWVNTAWLPNCKTVKLMPRTDQWQALRHGGSWRSLLSQRLVDERDGASTRGRKRSSDLLSRDPSRDVLSTGGVVADAHRMVDSCLQQHPHC